MNSTDLEVGDVVYLCRPNGEWVSVLVVEVRGGSEVLVRTGGQPHSQSMWVHPRDLARRPR